MKVNVKEIAEELQTLGDEDCFFYNKTTGELEYFNDEQENPNGLDFDEVDADENFLPFPYRYDCDDYGIMKNFMYAQSDPKIHDAIYDAIHQKGAFRKFRDTVEKLGFLQQWYDFCSEKYQDIVKQWCEVNALEWE